jgi:hypothetical protein
MSKECAVASLEDIAYDVAGTDRAAGQLAEFFAARPADMPKRRVRTRGVVALGMGRKLLQQCPKDAQTRYETLLYFEGQLPPEKDHGFLIGPACQILEGELNRLLAVPARGIAERLVAALQIRKQDRQQAEILADWAAQKIPTTIGVMVLVLLALRRGCEHGDAAITEFLAAHFKPRYADLLRSKKLGACLDAIRTDFRNPVSHGAAIFDPAAYERFTGLMVANQRFAIWDAAGPVPPEPDAAIGVFHHHLSQSR